MKRLEFVKSIFAISFVNTKKENTIEEYLIEKGFNVQKAFNTREYYNNEKTIAIIRHSKSNEFKVRNYYNLLDGEIKNQFNGKIENVKELKQLFKFLEIN